jgi:hypothetical protein
MQFFSNIYSPHYIIFSIIYASSPLNIHNSLYETGNKKKKLRAGTAR